MKIPDAIKEVLINKVAEGTLLCLCSAEPTTFDQATDYPDGTPAGYLLGSIALTAGIDNGDFTVADSNVTDHDTGRMLVVAAQENISIAKAGTITHAAIVNGTELLAVDDSSGSIAVTASSTINLNSFKWVVEDVVAAA